MGRGSTTREINVKKERPQIQASGSSNSSSRPDGSIDNCLFSFSDKTEVSKEVGSNIQVANSVVLVPSTTDASLIDLYINGKNVGLYSGRYRQRIVECSAKNYTYEGLVEKISKTPGGLSIGYSVQGFGR